MLRQNITHMGDAESGGPFNIQSHADCPLIGQTKEDEDMKGSILAVVIVALLLGVPASADEYEKGCREDAILAIGNTELSAELAAPGIEARVGNVGSALGRGLVVGGRARSWLARFVGRSGSRLPVLLRDKPRQVAHLRV